MLRSLILGEEPWPLFVWGAAGRGKTCAALCVLDHSSGWYRSVPELADEVIEVTNGRRKTIGVAAEGGGLVVRPDQFWKELESARLVVLDELGQKLAVTDHHYGVVKRVLDRREGRPTIILSNCSPTQIEKLYDDRIASRCLAGTVIELKGRDRRVVKGKP